MAVYCSGGLIRCTRNEGYINVAVALGLTAADGYPHIAVERQKNFVDWVGRESAAMVTPATGVAQCESEIVFVHFRNKARDSTDTFLSVSYFS